MATTTAKQAAEIVNETLKTLGYDYQIDTSSNDAIEQGFNAIGAYPPNQLNTIMEQMNLVMQYRNYGVMFDADKNKFRSFLVDLTENGYGVEDVFHELVDALPALWDNNTSENDQEILKDLVSYDTAKIDRAFHVDSDSARFKATIDTRNYRKVFTQYGVTRYIDTKLANMSWSAEKWLQNIAVDLIKSMNADRHIVYVGGQNINSIEGVNRCVEELKTCVAGFLTPTKVYNYGAYDKTSDSFKPVINMTDSEDDIFIITTPENFTRIKVQGYSNAFNLSQYELDGRVIFAPAGTDLGTAANGEKVLFYVIDRRAILLGIKHWQGGTFVVPNAARLNQWLLTEILKGYNTFFNAVAITGDSVGSFFGSDGAEVVFGTSDSTGSASPLMYYAVNDSTIFNAFGYYVANELPSVESRVRSVRLKFGTVPSSLQSIVVYIDGAAVLSYNSGVETLSDKLFEITFNDNLLHTITYISK